MGKAAKDKREEMSEPNFVVAWLWPESKTRYDEWLLQQAEEEAKAAEELVKNGADRKLIEPIAKGIWKKIQKVQNG